MASLLEVSGKDPSFLLRIREKKNISSKCKETGRLIDQQGARQYLWNNIGHSEAFTEGLRVVWIVLGLCHETHLILCVTVILGVCPVVAMDTTVWSKLRPFLVFVTEVWN